MKKITVEEIMKLKPCSDYPEEKVKDLIGNGKTPLEILDLPISKSDKFWLLLRPEYISERNLHLLACDFAQDVAHMNPDPRVQAAIDAKRLWVDGKITDEELKKAKAAAYAAYAATRAAAYAACAYAAAAARAAASAADADAAARAWAVAYAARAAEAAYAYAATYAAAWARDAAYAAASAACANVETKQIEMVRKVFIDMGVTK